LGLERIIERERRWARPTAVIALVPVVLYAASILIDQSANLYSGDSDAEQLRSLHDHSGAILLSSVLRGIGFLMLPVPLVYLFRAAQARNPRVQGALVGFVLLGPILFAAQGIVQSAAASRVSSDFVELPEEQSRPYSELEAQLNKDPKSIEKVTIYTGPNVLEVEQTDGTFYAVRDFGKRSAEKVVSSLPSDLERPGVDTDNDSDGSPGDALARHLLEDSTGVQVAQGLLFPAVLGMVVGMIYTPLQALRAGLLTRFFGTLGMALGASLILILPAALLGILLWSAYFGLLLIGRVPGGRPPAWEAGEAIPWPRPGEERSSAPRPSGESIEGEATEVPAAGEPAEGSPGGQPGSRKRKRKRRR
jgi:hypothetical protein